MTKQMYSDFCFIILSAAAFIQDDILLYRYHYIATDIYIEYHIAAIK